MDDSPSKEVVRDSNGQFLPGHPPLNEGRPKGSKNKFTKIKEEIASLWEEGAMKKQILLLLQDPKEAKEILKIMTSLMPKEDVDPEDKIEELPFTILEDPSGK